MASSELTLNVTISDWPPIRALIEAATAWAEWARLIPRGPLEQALLEAIEALPERMASEHAPLVARAASTPPLCIVCGRPCEWRETYCLTHRVLMGPSPG